MNDMTFGLDFYDFLVLVIALLVSEVSEFTQHLTGVLHFSMNH